MDDLGLLAERDLEGAAEAQGRLPHLAREVVRGAPDEGAVVHPLVLEAGAQGLDGLGLGAGRLERQDLDLVALARQPHQVGQDLGLPEGLGHAHVRDVQRAHS